MFNSTFIGLVFFILHALCMWLLFLLFMLFVLLCYEGSEDKYLFVNIYFNNNLKG